MEYDGKTGMGENAFPAALLNSRCIVTSMVQFSSPTSLLAVHL